MSRLELEIQGYNYAIETMTVNGKSCKMTNKNNSTKTCIIENIEGKAEVVIYKAHHYIGKNWFWWNLLYFLVSIFGIFDVRHDKKFLVVDCRFNVLVSGDTKAVLMINDFKDGGRFLDVECENNIEKIANKQYFDKTAKEKHKKMKKAKIGITVASLVAIALILIFVL